MNAPCTAVRCRFLHCEDRARRFVPILVSHRRVRFKVCITLEKKTYGINLSQMGGLILSYPRYRQLAETCRAPLRLQVWYVYVLRWTCQQPLCHFYRRGYRLSMIQWLLLSWSITIITIMFNKKCPASKQSKNQFNDILLVHFTCSMAYPVAIFHSPLWDRPASAQPG